MRNFLATAGIAVAALLTTNSTAQAAPTVPIEALGEEATLRFVRLSPDGEHVAYLKREKGKELLAVIALSDGSLKQAIEVNGFIPRGLRWIGNDHAVLTATKLTNDIDLGTGTFRFQGMISLNINTGKTAQLLSKGQDLPVIRGGTSMTVMSVDEKKDKARVFANGGIYEIDLDSRRGKKVMNADRKLFGVLFDEDGNITWKEHFDYRSKRYSIVKVSSDGEDRTVYQENNVEYYIPNDGGGISFWPKYRMSGHGDNYNEIVVYKDSDGETDSYNKPYIMSAQGEIEDFPYYADNPETEVWPINNPRTRLLGGAGFGGLKTSYEFSDPRHQAIWQQLESAFPSSAVTVSGLASDNGNAIVSVSGSEQGVQYFLLNSNNMQLRPLANARPEIKPGALGAQQIISFKARDGMEIPALVTWPAGVEPGSAKNLPLLALPHGGPEAQDFFGFDWFSQIAATRGILVVQPQFRGSTGFGQKHRDAGRGRWGAEMQDDVTDSVKYLIDNGYANPDNVCIFGWSYGGYSALAGATFTPELYKCVIAGAGVADVPKMLNWVSREQGSDGGSSRYWKRVIGDRFSDRDKLIKMSPARFADKVQAPILLIHGENDDVVPPVQSEIMLKALKDAGKDVRYVELKGEDHWMSKTPTRLQTAKEIEAFLVQHMLGGSTN